MKFKFNKSSGQVSKILLVLAVVVLVATIITYLVIRMAEKPQKPVSTEPEAPQPVYEQTLGNIKFTFQNAVDSGSVLRASEALNSSSWQKDFLTTERFITVTIGAQNKGKTNIQERSWDIENIIDSDGREFVASDSYTVNPWLPNPNLCGALLKPEFDPTPCAKIYEVSKKSKGLKIRVLTGKDNDPSNFGSNKFDQALIDLIVTQ